MKGCPMSDNTIAVLLNCFAYPGSGHIKLGHRSRGIAFICVATSAAAFLMFFIIQQAYGVIFEMQSQGASIIAILAQSHAIQESLYSSPNPIIKYSLLTLLVSWALSMIDIIYLINKHKNKPDAG